MVSEGTVVTDDVILGECSYINRASSAEKCTIGRYCSISSGVWINPYEHDTTHSTSPRLGGSESDLRERVIIGDDVLISLNAIILNGVHVGTGSIIAAGAVVTKDVEPFTVVGGVPAKKYQTDILKK